MTTDALGCPSIASLIRSADISPACAAAIATLFFAGWVLTRGANLQKFVYKRRSEHPSRGDLDATWLGLPMRVVPGTRLLCSGFWGLARHVNYCGEIVQVSP